MLTDSISHANTVIGTPYYMSPELCENAPYNYKVRDSRWCQIAFSICFLHPLTRRPVVRVEQSDVWALGCVLYELTTLNHAFDASNMCALVLAILRGKYPPIDTRYSADLRRLVSRMLQSDVRGHCRAAARSRLLL